MKHRAGSFALILAVALAGCGSRGPAASEAGSPTPQHSPAPIPAPKAAPPGTLAYALDGDIYVADPDGSNPVKIVDGRSEGCARFGSGADYWIEPSYLWPSEGSAWSPDGTYLAFRYSDCSSGSSDWVEGVVISDAKGNELARFPTGRGWHIAWSPDSTRVAVWDDFGKTIGIYGTDGVRQAQLQVPPEYEPHGDFDPVWTPEGVSPTRARLVVLPLDGGPPLEVASPEDEHLPSPDGSRVAWVRDRSLKVARPDGSDAMVVHGDWSSEPSWSSTGEQIAIATSRTDRSASPTQLRVLDVATGSVRLLTEAEHGSDLGVVGFTPKGDRILFSTMGESGWSLWSIGLDGSDARLLLHAADAVPNFSRVAWTSEGETDRPTDGGSSRLPTEPDAWQRVMLPDGAPACLEMGCMVRSVAANHAGLVAMGSAFAPAGERFVGWSSSDGRSWHQIEGDGGSDVEDSGVARARFGFVAARSGDILTSTDGVAWASVVPPGAGSGVGDPSVSAVTAGGPGVVAVGGSPGKAWYSSAGIRWKAANVPSSPRTDMAAVAAGAGRVVAIGWKRIGRDRFRLVMWVSSDGKAWREPANSGGSLPGRCRVTDLAGGPAGFVATGWCGDGFAYHVWRSPDGVGWLPAGHRFDPRSVAVGIGPKGFLAVDAHGVWTSVDGGSWTRIPSPAFHGPVAADVTAWGSRIVVVGSDKDGPNAVWISGPQR